MTDSIIVFAGPSLAGVDLTDFENLEFRTPCRQGDLYLATQNNPSAVAIIDGYFEGQPSVWHKEILYALSKGIHVFGASSMGALRAAETHIFGMQGIGAIFEAYRDGEICDDDEVALIHGPAELESMPLSEPMVNVRATCSLAVEQSLFSPEMAQKICAIAKDQFYKERTWDTILDQLATDNLNDFDLTAFTNWLTESALDQKKIDALQLLDVLDEFDLSKPFKADFEFVETEFWHQMTVVWDASNKQKLKVTEDQSAGAYRLLD